MKHFCTYHILFLLLLCITSCDDMHDIEPSRNDIKMDSIKESKIWILCEGLFNMNNSTLALYDCKNQQFTSDVFTLHNGRGLGDTANKMKLYGGKLYIVMNVSSQIEVLDPETGISIQRIPMFNKKNIARQPRYIEFDKNKAYVCNFDGTVARIDTTTLKIDTIISVGRNPDGICKAGNNLYVSNSGGLDYPNYDNTISVIDLNTFTEINRIEVGKNPGSIVADKDGDVYVVSRGDYSEEYTLQRIDTKLNTVVEIFHGFHPLNLFISNDIGYFYCVDYLSNKTWISVFDCKTEKIIREQFITDDTKITLPYAISVDEKLNRIFICDAYDYVTNGDIYCFNSDGKMLFKIESVGLNPNTVIVKY